MKPLKYIKPAALAVFLAFIDQLTKHLAVLNLRFQSDYMFINNFLSLTYHENEGAAFGMFQGGRWAFVVFTVLLCGAICYYYISLPDNKINLFVKFSLVLVLAGALGNFIDRLFNGYVVDFLQFEFIDFPIFNVADIYVVAGTAALCVLVIFFVKEEKPEDGEGEKAVLNHDE